MAKTVLYIEDEPDDVLFMRVAFKRLGLQATLHSVSDGRKAIAYFAGEPPYSDRTEHPLPSVVLLDLNLPVVSGFEVLKWLKQQAEFKDVPVVIFSSSGRPEDRARASELGASEYLLKPASGLEFPDIVEGFRQRWLPPAT